MKRTVAIPALILVLALAICAGAFSATGEAKQVSKAKEIKIGQIVDLTGPESAIGTKQKLSLAFANKVLPTIAGAKVTVIVGDAIGTPQGAQDQALKLITQDKVAAIFGPTQVTQKSAVAVICKKYKVPLFLYNPSPTNLFKNKYVVGCGGASPQCPSAEAMYIRKVLKAKTISTLGPKESNGHAFVDPLTKTFKKLGGKVLDQKWVATGTSDYSPYVTTIKQADYLVAWTTGADAVAFWNAYYSSGRYQSMPVAGTFSGGFTQGFISIPLSSACASAFLGTTSPSFWSPDGTSKVNQAFIASWTNVYGQPPADDADSGPYQAYLVFKAAVEKAKGKTASPAILAAVKQVKVFGPEGATAFKGSNCASKTISILKNVAGNGKPFKWDYKTVKQYLNVPPLGL
jgi:branched-chain amino acid transport system substrate-binding protein